MRISPELENGRVRIGYFKSSTGDDFGAFFIDGPCNRKLQIIASNRDENIGINWEHVSVSLQNRCPNWEEMCFVKDLFGAPEECVMQFHPPRSRYVNNHQFCLHLWKPTDQEIPLPPEIAIGFKSLNI